MNSNPRSWMQFEANAIQKFTKPIVFVSINNTQTQMKYAFMPSFHGKPIYDHVRWWDINTEESTKIQLIGVLRKYYGR